MRIYQASGMPEIKHIIFIAYQSHCEEDSGTGFGYRMGRYFPFDLILEVLLAFSYPSSCILSIVLVSNHWSQITEQKN